MIIDAVVRNMSNTVIFDSRNILYPEILNYPHINYFGIGFNNKGADS